jgi:hypothetical protein
MKPGPAENLLSAPFTQKRAADARVRTNHPLRIITSESESSGPAGRDVLLFLDFVQFDGAVVEAR